MPETAAARPLHLPDRLAEVFKDVAVRQGLKMALAGLLGFAAALWLKLPNPTWCIFTVVVLMLAQYVGAIAEKAMLRAIGTAVGALIGILLVGNFANSPLVLLAATFLVTMVGTTMFGGNWYPYAFFLGALTSLVVIGTTMESPGDAWHVGSSRCLEIGLGILVTTVITSIIWPRYARVEFQAQFRETLRAAGKIAVARSRHLLAGEDTDPPPELVETELRFVTRMNTLRLLLRYGQRESEYFRTKLPIRRRMIGELGALFEAAESLGQRLPKQSRYRKLISEELQILQTQLERDIDSLLNNEAELDPANAPLAAAVSRCEARLTEIRDQGLTREIPVQEAMDFSAHFTAMLDIATRLQAIRRCLHQLFSTTEVIVPLGRTSREPLRITAFWVRIGIKGGLTAVIALIYVNWINPPGGLTIPFAAWLLTSSSRLYPGGEGDRRAFSYVIRIALIGIPYCLLLLLISPFLASYFWMNVFLAVGLFLLGFTFAKQGGITLYGQSGMLFFVGTIGLNAQDPVGFPQITNVYFGVVLALLISACVQRLLWPLLPQREICSLFAEFFARCRELLGPMDAAALAHAEERLALIPSEADAWIHVANTPEYPAGEREKLHDLLRDVERLGYCILSTRKLTQIEAPSEVSDRMREHLATLEASVRETLTTFEATFHHGPAMPPCRSQLAAFEPLEIELSEIRQRYLSGALHFPAAIAYLGAMNFVEDAVRTIDRCAKKIQDLDLDRYRGDYAL